MYNVKNDQNSSRKGNISFSVGDRKYFGENLNTIFNSGKGYYSNIHHTIFGKFK